MYSVIFLLCYWAGISNRAENEWHPISGCVSRPMRSKARRLVQHGGPPGWLEESDPAAGSDFVHDRRSLPPALTDHIACPGLGMLYYFMDQSAWCTLQIREDGGRGVLWFITHLLLSHPPTPPSLLFSPSDSSPSYYKPSLNGPWNLLHLVFCLLTIKLPMYMLIIWGWTYEFGWEKSISRGVWRGGPWNLDFFGPKMELATQVAIWGPKKVSISGPTHANAPRYGLIPCPNPYVPPHINNRYINS
jgi:hypothetical protein